MNLNTAGPDTLALTGLDANQVDRIIGFNSGKVRPAPGAPPWFRSVAEAQALLGATVPLAGFDTVVRCLRIRVTVREGATSLHLAVVVTPVGAVPPAGSANATAAPPTVAGQNLGYPFTLLAIEENIELAPPPLS